jgi:hypothetical protein
MVNENSFSVTPNTTKMKCFGNGPQYDPRSDLLKAIRDGKYTYVVVGHPELWY